MRAITAATGVPREGAVGSILMLGPPKPRRLDQPIAVSIEALVPWPTFYRHLEATLDLGFVRDWLRGALTDSPTDRLAVYFRLPGSELASPRGTVSLRRASWRLVRGAARGFYQRPGLLYDVRYF